MRSPLLILPGLVLLLTACGGGSNPGSSVQGPSAVASVAPKRVAVIPKGNSHEFWQAVRRGVELADAADASVTVEYKGPEKENDPAQQKALVETYLSTGIDAIGLAPNDSATLSEVVDLAKAQGKPVVIFDSGIGTDSYDSFIATDNRLAGKMAGEHLAQMLNGQGKVILVRYQTGSASTEAREAGFLEAMAANPGITLISQDQEGANREKEVAQNLLARFGSEVTGVFTPNESTTRGMMLALREGGYYAKSVAHIGFDVTPELVASVKAGELKGFVIQNPVKMGFLTVKTISARLAGKVVQKSIDTGAVLVTPENIDDGQVQKIMNNEWQP